MSEDDAASALVMPGLSRPGNQQQQGAAATHSLTGHMQAGTSAIQETEGNDSLGLDTIRPSRLLQR